MSAAAQVQRSEIAASVNPTINQAGQAQFPASAFCTWTTNNGSQSTVVVTNPGNQNTLTVIISGAPSTILTATGQPLNGEWTIPPNSPTSNVTAFGNFLGTIVTLFNLSNPSTTCKVVAQVAK